jgi:hypothetical protein
MWESLPLVLASTPPTAEELGRWRGEAARRLALGRLRQWPSEPVFPAEPRPEGVGPAVGGAALNQFLVGEGLASWIASWSSALTKPSAGNAGGDFVESASAAAAVAALAIVRRGQNEGRALWPGEGIGPPPGRPPAPPLPGGVFEEGPGGVAGPRGRRYPFPQGYPPELVGAIDLVLNECSGDVRRLLGSRGETDPISVQVYAAFLYMLSMLFSNLGSDSPKEDRHPRWDAFLAYWESLPHSAQGLAFAFVLDQADSRMGLPARFSCLERGLRWADQYAREVLERAAGDSAEEPSVPTQDEILTARLRGQVREDRTMQEAVRRSQVGLAARRVRACSVPASDEARGLVGPRAPTGTVGRGTPSWELDAGPLVPSPLGLERGVLFTPWRFAIEWISPRRLWKGGRL